MTNTRSISILLAVIVCASLSCRDNQKPAEDLQKQANTVSKDTIINYDSLLSLLIRLQNSISANPRDSRLIPPLLTEAFDTVSGSFLIVGKGIPNKEFPEAAWDAARKMAALQDGKRWGLYLKAWRTGDMRNFGQTISGTITYSKVLFDRLSNDTLYQLIQIPIGSIVIQ
jgi:hypothetical protein